MTAGIVQSGKLYSFVARYFNTIPNSMKRRMVLAIMVACTSVVTLYAQNKPPLDTGVFGKWPALRDPHISPDGNFVFYTIVNMPAGAKTLMVQNIRTGWKKELLNATGAAFTDKSGHVVFMTPGDSLGILSLATSGVAYVPGVSSFNIPLAGTAERLLYLSHTGQLCLLDVLSGKRRSFPGVSEYFFAPDGKSAYFLAVEKDHGDTIHSLQRIDLKTDQRTAIWNGSSARNFVFDPDGHQLAFLGEAGIGSISENGLWYYKAGNSKATMLAERSVTLGDEALRLESIEDISKDGRNIFVRLSSEEVPAAMTKQQAGMGIWSYADGSERTEWLENIAKGNVIQQQQQFGAVLNTATKRLVRLEFPGDQCALRTSAHAFVIHNNSTLLVQSLEQGTRQPVNVLKDLDWWFVSPESKYIIFFDPRKMDYFSYAIPSGKVTNLTAGLPREFPADTANPHDARFIIRDPQGWTAGDRWVVLNYKDDLWLVDPSGINTAVSITNGYGYKHQVTFKILNEGAFLFPGEKIVMAAFRHDSKENGFFSKVLGKPGDPQILTMGPYIYDVPQNQIVLETPPVKARDAEGYLVTRMCERESPNLFFTTDFRAFHPLSSIFPERQYNWLGTTLISWKTTDGRPTKGILYKPEDFDSTRKYPVIIYYYEKLSDMLHLYLPAKASEGQINIPWFVSNGYLVLVADIQYSLREPGGSALNAIVGAAQYLSGMPFIDSTRIGIQGHSFGGFETNYIVTHTDRFAAACSAAGLSNFVSLYGRQSPAINWRKYFEIGQGRMGKPLWELPNAYVKNSPVFDVARVATPLLIMHNRNDAISPFEQAVDFYIALRSKGKKAWLLQYDDGGHTVGGRSAIDYTIRLTQFFDHYLKGAPAPQWMSEAF